ncbi:MAG: right-handed parallel beta-helix repeat-containing protein, partial [Bacteroidota bacterium]
AYLDNLLEEFGPELARNEALLRTEYLHYSFDRTRLLERAATIREELAGINMEEELARRSGDFERPTPQPPRDTSATLREEVSVIAHSWSEQASPGIQLRNFHHQRVRVVGGITAHGETIRLTSAWIAPYANGKPAPQATVMTPVPVVQLTVEAAGSGPEITIPIIDHVAPQDRAPAQAVLNTGTSLEQFGTLTDSGWVIRPGRHALNQHLIIPAGTALHIGPGTTLDLHKGANIIAYSPVYLAGTAQAPVAVISSDRTGGGLAVLQAGKPSRLEHVQFKGLNTLDINGWTLTGAVTFYESDVAVNRVSFSHAQCEDALNIIRSAFTVTQCDFDHSYGDAFDADFCQGEVADCRFTEIGNDGLDFSGSNITVTGCTLQGIGDKAVSVGEQSTTRLDGLSVDGAKVGFTAKDLSRLEVRNCQLAACRFMYAAFQKKPEFGPATMRLVGLTNDELTGEYVIQQGSQLETDDGPINGTQDLDIDQLFYDK